MSFDELGLLPALLRAVRARGYSQATPIQAQTIPAVLDGHDLMGCAETGTGKTAAFALPTLQRLSDRGASPSAVKRAGRRPIRSLVLAPTRELAAQIAAFFSAYGQFTGLRCAVVYGGVSQGRQVQALQSGVDILVATPGRLLDLMQQRCVDLNNISILILDEADRMLDMGFLPDLRRIVAATPRQRQTLMFSATMPDEIRQLADCWLRDPKRVQVTPVAAPPALVKQSVYLVATQNKPQLLAHFLRVMPCTRTLIFARTKHGADKIVKLLERTGIRAVAMHSNKSQSARSRTLEQFKSNQPPVLVATDIAARGLDVGGISHVINYELPEVPETYVHRIGRTGRAGVAGTATSFCGDDERCRLQRIERLMRRTITVAQDHPVYTPPSPSLEPASPGSAPRAARQGRRPNARRPTRFAGRKTGDSASRLRLSRSAPTR